MKETEFDYKNLFNDLPGPYVVFGVDDPDFTILAENTAHTVVGLTAGKEVIGKGLFEVWPDTSEKFVKTGISDLAESLRKVIRTGKADYMESLRYDLPNSDGVMEEHHFQVVHYPLRQGGKVIAVYQATNDVTEEVLADTKVASLQRTLNQAFAIGQVGSWALELKTNKVIADRNLAHMFGIDPKQAAKNLPLEVFTNTIYEEDRQHVIEQITKAIQKDQPYEEEYRINADEGRAQWVIARGRLEKDAEGTPIVFAGVVVDIHERKMNDIKQRFLAEASKQFSATLNYKKTLKAVSDQVVPSIAEWCGIDLLDETGHIVQVVISHRDKKRLKDAARLRELQPVDMSAKTGLPNVLRTGKPEFWPEITEAMITASTTDTELLKLLKKLDFKSVIIVPLKQEQKTIGAITLVAAGEHAYFTQADFEMAQELAQRASLAITNSFLYDSAKRELVQRKKLQEKLNEANAELESRVVERTAQLNVTNTELKRSNQELQDFAYVASHDLQEPLRKIQAFGDLMAEEYGVNLGDGKDYLDRMRNAAARMSVLIEDLLSFSRVTTQAQPFKKVELNRIVKEVLNDIEMRIEDSGGVVEVSVLPAIWGDPLQLRQLFQNLISNALKFARPNVKPVVKIYAKEITEKNGEIVHTIYVEDNGIGFDEKYLDRIFAVFQRLHTKDVYKGTGIGLAICRKIMDRHSGNITAESGLDKGSTFIMTFPQQAAKPLTKSAGTDKEGEN